jgi:GNAT superfamily N-acetyltransferase
VNIKVGRAESAAIANLRDLYRQEADCQVVRDSFLVRGFADAYVIRVDGRVGGYALVANKHVENRLIEFYVLPSLRHRASALFREALFVSRAGQIEAQTNIPLPAAMLREFATDIGTEHILFMDHVPTSLASNRADFRRSTGSDRTDSDWVLELDGETVASGGFLCHYNPPYADVYMEVKLAWRKQGFGSYLVQELKRVCLEAGKRPAARCDPENDASRRTLERAGFVVAGALLAGKVSANAIAAGI